MTSEQSSKATTTLRYTDTLESSAPLHSSNEGIGGLDCDKTCWIMSKDALNANKIR